MVIATGITANGDREILGLDIGDSEDETFWTRFLRSLKDRGRMSPMAWWGLGPP